MAARASIGGEAASPCSFRIETGAGCARWINAIPVIRHGDSMMIIQRRNVIIGQSQHTAQDGRWWCIYTCQWPAWLDQHTRNNAYTGRWTPSTETILSLPFSLPLSHSRPMFHCILLHLHGYTYTRYSACVWPTIVKECCSASHGNLAGDNEPPRLVSRLKRVAATRFFAIFREKLAILEFGTWEIILWLLCVILEIEGRGDKLYVYKFWNSKEHLTF